jgi:hypothetical protein
LQWTTRALILSNTYVKKKKKKQIV